MPFLHDTFLIFRRQLLRHLRNPVWVVIGLTQPILYLAFFVLLAISIASLSYAGGLLTKSEDAFAPLTSTIAVPVMLLSGVLLPISKDHAPRWLNILSKFSPFRHIVDAMREVFRGHYVTGQ